MTHAELDEVLAPYGLDAQRKVDAVNSLINQTKIKVFSKADGTMFFKVVSEEHAARMKNLSDEEKLVYTMISESGSEGVIAP